jgi:hypothetical protein
VLAAGWLSAATALLLALQLRLNAQQLEEKRAAEAAVEEVQELIEAETSEAGEWQQQQRRQANGVVL